MNEKTKTAINKLLALFESGEIPEALSIAVLPELDVPCSKWSLTNRLLVFLSGTSDARGFQQWKTVGRYPKKGSKALHIFTPRRKKTKDENSEETMGITRFQSVPVFRFEDTQGEDLEIPELAPEKYPPLYEIAEEWGLEVNWQSYQGNYYGFYSPSRESITLATHDEAVFFHELAHAAHHKVKGKMELGQEWKQEIVAELTAIVLASLHCKKANYGGSYSYITSYAEKAGKDPLKACLSVISDVEKCLGILLEKTEKKFQPGRVGKLKTTI